jgi:ABC-type branched-subunit amino acid transport system substrate-binding protein
LKHYWFLLFAFVALILFAACEKTVQVGSQPEPPAPAIEQQVFNQQLNKINQPKKDLAIKGLQAFIKRYPNSRLADDAYYQMGSVQLKQQQYREAARSFQHIIEDFPTSDTGLLAKYYYGLAHQKIGDIGAVLPVLQTVQVRTLPSEFRLSFLELLREGYRQQKADEKVFQTNLEILEFNPSDLVSRDEIIKSLDLALAPPTVTPAVDAETSGVMAAPDKNAPATFETNKNFLEKVASDYEGRFPADYALMKLGRLYWEQGDFERSKNRLSMLLSRFRDAGKATEFAKEAEELLQRLERIGKAQPGKIGVLLPLSGNFAPIGQRILHGILLGSGLFDNPESPENIQIVVRDTGGDPDKAVQAMGELVIEQQVVGIIGPALKKPAMAVAKAAVSYNVPVILMSQDEALSGENPFVFQNCLLKSEQVKALVRFAAVDMQLKRVAVLYPTHNFGQEMFWLIWNELAKYPDIQVRAVESYDKDTNDFSPAIRRLSGLFYLRTRNEKICSEKDKAKLLAARTTNGAPGATAQPPCFTREELPPIVDFEALFLPDSAEKVRQIAPTLSYHGIKGVQLFGVNLWNTPDLLEKGTTDYLQGAIFVDGFDSQSQIPAVQIFMNRYRKEFGENPDILVAQAYDTMMMLRQAQKQSQLDDRDNLRRYLKNMPPFTGATGTTTFNEIGQAKRQLNFFYVDGNQLRLVVDPH